MPSHSPHASRPSTFRAPGWGALALLSSCCRWRSATSWDLVPFSHRSASRIFIRQPGCIPSPMVTRDGDHQFDGGEKQAGLRPLPHPQLQGSSSSLLGRRARLSRGLPSCGLASRFFLRLLGVETILQLCGGGALQPCRGRRTAAAQSRVQQSVLCPSDGGQSHQGVSQHVVRREGGTRVLGWSHSRFRGEDESEDLPMRFGAPGARWCGVGGQVDAAVGAEVVAAGESFSADETVSASRGPTSGSLALMSGSRPSSGDTNESLPAAASVLGPSLLLQRSLASRPEFVVPQALRCGGCSYPREWNRSSVCNGTLSAGVCSLWLSGPEHLGILGVIPCFFLISSTRTRLSAS
jgi:hypothetical protein